MDRISFGSNNSVYRAPGTHAYVVGEDGVTGITETVGHVPIEATEASPNSLCGKIHVEWPRPMQPSSITFDGSAFQGSTREIYHLKGVLQIYRTNIQFKGVQGTSALASILEDIAPICPQLDASTRVTVHNAVFTFRLGYVITTEGNGHFARSAQDTIPGLEVVYQPWEEELCVMLKLHSDNASASDVMQYHFPEGCVPTVVDFKVASRGAVQARLSWVDCPWDQGMEDTTVAYLNHMAEVLRACC